MVKVAASGPGGVLPSSNYILTPQKRKRKRNFPFLCRKNVLNNLSNTSLKIFFLRYPSGLEFIFKNIFRGFGSQSVLNVIFVLFKQYPRQEIVFLRRSGNIQDCVLQTQFFHCMLSNISSFGTF